MKPAATDPAGVHRQPGFLDASVLQRVSHAMNAGEAEAAEVLGDNITTEDLVRRATSIEVDEATLGLVEGLLDQYRGVLAEAFGVTLTSREGPSFLRYGPGGFYAPHRDRADVPSWPDAARRLIAVVIFLNSTRTIDPAGDFDGGALRLLSEDGEPVVEVHPQAGLLAAFQAERLHEVTRVRAGTRATIVDWYY